MRKVLRSSLLVFMVLATLITSAQETEIDTSVFQYELISATDTITSLQRSKDFAYVKYLDSLLKKAGKIKADTISLVNATPSRRSANNRSDEVRSSSKTDNSFFNSPVVKSIFWILAIGFISFILYRLFLGEGIFRRNRKLDRSGETNEEEAMSDPDSYDRLIKDAIAIGNFRLALRYRYIQTLQRLSAKGAINFSVDKTNYEYIREIAPARLQKDFASITYNYEYVWYGRFDINEQKYGRMQNEVNLFTQKIPS